MKKSNVILPSSNENAIVDIESDISGFNFEKRMNTSDRNLLIHPDTSLSLSKRQNSNNELISKDTTKSACDGSMGDMNHLERRSNTDAVSDTSVCRDSAASRPGLSKTSSAGSTPRMSPSSSVSQFSIDAVSDNIASDKKMALQRASRSASPEFHLGAQDVAADLSDTHAGRIDHHKRSSSEPSVAPSEDNSGNSFTHVPTKSKRNGSTMPQQQGIPTHVSPRNLVLRFDARKDNLSFSAINEKDEAVSSREDLVPAGLEGSMDRSSESQASDFKTSGKNQPRTRESTPPSREFARVNGLDPMLENSSNNNKASKSSSEKKKKGYWANVLSPNYKSKSEDFRKIFKDVPDTERLIVDYSCAMQKDILVHGRLYITQNWVCFYANIFKWETVLTIQCKDIIAIQKEKTARVIPNAVSICTKDERHFFTSFGSRDKTYLMIFRVWQNALCDVQMNPTELWQWVHHSYGEELGLTSSDDDYVAPDMDADPPSLFDTQLDLAGSQASSHAGSTNMTKEPCEDDGVSVSPGSPNGTRSPSASVSDVSNNEKPVSRRGKPPATLDVPAPGAPPSVSAVHDSPTDNGDTTEDDELNGSGEVECASHEHNGFTSLDDVFNIPIAKLFDFIFADSQLYRDFIAARKTFDFVTEPWPEQLDSDGNKVRNLSYTLSLNYSIGPKTSPSTEKQIWFGAYSKPGSIYVVDTEVINGGVPYSDNFYVVNRYCITRVSNNRSRLRITSQIKYRKNCWGLVKRMVDKAAHEGLNTNFQFLGEFLHKEGELMSSPAAGQHISTKTKKLQKRRRTQPSERISSHHGLSKHAIAVPQHSTHAIERPRDEKHVSLSVDVLVRILLVMLIFLILFNAVLYYKLWSLESRTGYVRSSVLRDTTNSPKSDEEWLQLLEQQEQLHVAELGRWQDILSTSIKLMDHMKLTLSELKVSLEKRHGMHT